MNDPNDNGGLSATTPAEAFLALDAALSNPDCCKQSSSDWLARHVAFPQPSASDCLAQALEQLSRS
jgi:hypothetical protein